ncbi:hypothetical protein SAY86_011114 [Trapa natans]|uniref:SHSP domain-containing protein n=1 Tax=Trapa natans TaxID=22666 RepID=A0AAN7LXZ8_TRANT|nr:hypothetical protein SAY86_011114 [Trapa natans]
MEAEVARRRVKAITSHFLAMEDFPSNHHGILPMNCSGSLNSGTVRYGNRLLFARQTSSGQACFMRQQAPPTEQAISPAQPAASNKCSGPERPCNAYYGTRPLFSRPTREDPTMWPRMGLVQPVAQGCSLTLSELPPPQFACPSRKVASSNPLPPKKSSPLVANGNEWSPRMDVVESGQGYVLTVEIPGVCAKDIRVEVNDRNLVVMGKRSVQSWKLAGFTGSSISTSYHKREIEQGPYRVAWPLPNGVNKDKVSAEFLDGFLRIIIPKL